MSKMKDKLELSTKIFEATIPAFQNFNGMNVHERSGTFVNVRCSLSFAIVGCSLLFAIVPDRLFLLRKFF